MNVIKLKAGELVAKRQEKVMEWYLMWYGSLDFLRLHLAEIP